MRKVIDILGWVCVFITVVVLVITLLTTYQFIYLRHFNTYRIIQLCIFFTAITWSIKMFIQKPDHSNIIYPLLYMLLAMGTIFFMYIGVY